MLYNLKTDTVYLLKIENSLQLIYIYIYIYIIYYM